VNVLQQQHERRLGGERVDAVGHLPQQPLAHPPRRVRDGVARRPVAGDRRGR
jgi:hypothetical protein